MHPYQHRWASETEEGGLQEQRRACPSPAKLVNGAHSAEAIRHTLADEATFSTLAAALGLDAFLSVLAMVREARNGRSEVKQQAPVGAGTANF
jgi:hypothetical protein